MSLNLMWFEPTSETVTTYQLGFFRYQKQACMCFTWSFLNGDTDVHSVQLIINAEEWGVVNSHSRSNSWMQSTGLVVAYVNKGDDVF